MQKQYLVHPVKLMTWKLQDCTGLLFIYLFFPPPNSLQMNRPESPKTIITVTSHQTKPFGAVVIDTRWRTHTYTSAILLNQHLVWHLHNFDNIGVCVPVGFYLSAQKHCNIVIGFQVFTRGRRWWHGWRHGHAFPRTTRASGRRSLSADPRGQPVWQTAPRTEFIPHIQGLIVFISPLAKISLVGLWGGCWSWSSLLKGKGRLHPRMRSYLQGLSWASAVLWRCQDTCYCQHVFHLLSIIFLKGVEFMTYLTLTYMWTNTPALYEKQFLCFCCCFYRVSRRFFQA